MKMLISVRVLLFSAVCYSIAAQGAVTMVIDSLSGAITANEITSFKNFMATQTPPQTPWGDLNGSGHNAWCDGPGGTDLEAMSMMYEATGDTGILTNLVAWVDECVSQRNDLMSSANGGRRVGWDGVIDKTWIGQDLSQTPMSGCEGGDTAAHIAYCAKLILQHPSVWNLTVPDGNPNGYGVTYLDRARTYIAKCDEANDQYLVNYFVDPTTHLIRDPSDPAWTGLSTPINRQVMFWRGFLRLAECHELLGDSPSRVSQYDTIVNAAANECLSGMEHPHTVGGATVYYWYYYPWDTTHIETLGHAQYDTMGMYAAFNRKGNPYGFTRAEVNPIANNLVYASYLGTNTFAGNVDGSGTMQNYIYDGWLGLADWNASVYDIGATADKASTRYKTTPSMEAAILWMKNRRYLQFSVDASPVSQVVNSGSAKSFTVALSPLGAFSGVVTMSVSGLPSGATASYSSPSVNLATLGSATTNLTLTVSTGTSTPAGSYTLTVTGTSGAVSHSDTVTLVVANYTVSASPSSQSVTAGNSTTYTVNVGNNNGFSGSINLSAAGLPSGATASFSPSSVSAGGSSTLTVTTATSTPAGTNTLTVTGTSGSLSHSDTVTLIVNTAGLPSGWTDADIGAVGLAGSATYNNGVYTVNGSGSDIYGTADTFNYVSESVSGDLAVAARVASQANTSTWAKSGVMVRETTAAGSKFIGIYITPSNGVSMQLRSATGGSAVDLARQSGKVAPYYVKLVRSGNTFNGYSSPDGVTWTLVGSTNVTMTTTVTAGLAVCAHNNTALNTSTFDNVTVATALLFEAEALTVVTNTQTFSVIADSNCSGGQFVQLNGVAAGDLIKFLAPGVNAGTYDVRVGVKNNYNRAIIQTMGGKVGGSFGNLGSPFDEYSAAAGYGEVDIGPWSVSTSDKYIGFSVTGHNTSSTSYVVAVDYIKLVPQ